VPEMSAYADDPFLTACHGGKGRWTPVWFMRQAGRSLPEYRALRERHTMLDLCRTPELAAEVSLQPLRRLGVDAAILFSDIVVTLLGLGISLDIEPGLGPVIHEPLRSKEDIAGLGTLVPERDIPFVAESVRILVREAHVPVIGFAGAPFTLASYLIEGGPSRHHARTKNLMHTEPELWRELMERLASAVLASLRSQVEAGAAAVQLFDSWAGTLSPRDYERYALPASQAILEGLRDLGAPRIHFGVGTGELLALMADAGADVVGVDWRVPLDAARARVGGRALQGNLDPAALFAPADVVMREVDDVLKRGGGKGHIFNLGHGVLPDTDPEVLRRIVDHVHSRTEET